MSLWLRYLYLTQRYWYAFIALAIVVLFVDARIANAPLSAAISFVGGALIASGVIGSLKSLSNRKRSS